MTRAWLGRRLSRRGRLVACAWSPGLVIAVERWFIGCCIDKCEIDPDGWTVRSTDGSRAAHAEHAVAITSDGPVILTAPA